MWEDRQGEVQPFPLQMLMDAEKMDAAVRHGNTDLGIMPAGQIAGAIAQVKSAAEVVQEMAREAEEVLARLAQRFWQPQA